ncbi:MAG: GGDEF domain-containing protein [Candidatus Nanoarchaeia archaeon]|nr:GGDEF domain-containing protein [Candidatus Nanoarchaeia archaeon]
MHYKEEAKKLGYVYSELLNRNIVNKLKEENRNLKQENKTLRKQATIDELTGLPNKALAFEILKKEIFKSMREESNLSVSYFDINNFKNINDKYGHHIGDKVIKYFGKEVEKRLRKVDTLSRLHGDEFLAILPDAEEKAAYDVLRRITNIKPYENEIQLSASYGVAQFNKSDYNKKPIENIIENLIKKADDKMYEHKKSKNTKN